MHRCFALFTILLSAAPGAALAQTAPNKCPEGAWVCEEEEPPPALEAEAAPSPPRPEGSSEESRASPTPGRISLTTREPPPIWVDRPENEPLPAQRRRYLPYGLNLHVQGVLMGNHRDQSASSDMAGIGFGLRFLPIRHFGLDLSVDYLAGTDWNGFTRSEVAFMLNGLVVPNPRDKVQAQLFFGLGLSSASVTRVRPGGYWDDEQWGYFGGQLGAGLEVRVARNVGIGAALLGFLRGRIDDHALEDPEFINPRSHRATNSSGGALLRGGVTFYW